MEDKLEHEVELKASTINKAANGEYLLSMWTRGNLIGVSAEEIMYPSGDSTVKVRVSQYKDGTGKVIRILHDYE